MWNSKRQRERERERERMASGKMKIIFLGESNVGKSSLIRRLGEDKFDVDYDFETRGNRKGITEIKYSGSTFRLWDTKGEEQFQSLSPQFFKNASACVLTYDVSSNTSFNGAKEWKKELERRFMGAKVTVILAANKSDLQVQVDENMVKEFASQKGMILIKTSAKTGKNCSKLLDAIIGAATKSEQKKPVVSSSSGQDTSSAPSSAEGDGCCIIS